MRRSTRDLEDLRARLRTWLAGRLPEGSDPEISVSGPASQTGMSSETLLLDASWREGSRRRTASLVVRLAPDVCDVPVFPNYDLGKQFEALRLVRELTSVPVPKTWWLERDPAPVGSPFFVMSRVEGVVPPDVMPYTFGENWLYDAPDVLRRRLQQESISVLVRLHAVERPSQVFGFLSFDEPGSTDLERHFAHTRSWYAYAAADVGRSRLLERCFDWLEGHWPSTETETVLSWGDARIGNILYDGYRPTAVLDWEMAGLGPRELDVAWMIFSHRVFQEIANAVGFDGMPDFMRPEDVIDTYERESGRQLRDIAFYGTYAALQWGIVFMRTGKRQAYFGEITLPEDPDDLMHHRAALEKMADGRYWD